MEHLANADCRVHAQCTGCRLQWPRCWSYLVWRYKQRQWLSRTPYVWCFRNSAQQWEPFEMKNQAILWQAYYEPQHPYYRHECHICDRAIDSGKQVVRVVVHEHVAFSMDPDWSEPIVYEIQLCLAPPRRRRSLYAFWKRWGPASAEVAAARAAEDEALLAGQHSPEK